MRAWCVVLLVGCSPSTFTASAPAVLMDELVLASATDQPAFEAVLTYSAPDRGERSTAFLQLEGSVMLPELTLGVFEVLVDGTWPHDSVDVAGADTRFATSIEVPLACAGSDCAGTRSFGFRLVSPEGGRVIWRTAAQAQTDMPSAAATRDAEGELLLDVQPL